MNNKKDKQRQQQRPSKFFRPLKFFIFFILMFFVFNLNINAEQKSKAEEKKKPKLRFVIDEDKETGERKAILLLDSNDKEII